MMVWVELKGCDDSTSVEMDFSEGNLHMLQELVARFEAEAQSSCQPIMIIHEGPLPRR